MSKPLTSVDTSMDREEFLDYRGLDWTQIEKAGYAVHQRFAYTYPGPIRNLHQRMIAIPADQHGDQKLLDYRLNVSIAPYSIESLTDRFGNRIFNLFIPAVEREIVFELDFRVERTTEDGCWPRLPGEEAALYLQTSRLTAPDEKIRAVAAELSAQAGNPWELAKIINDWTYRAMTYGSGATSVSTNAAEALAGGKGLCQDYAHIMLSICREAGLPARYISGHLLGEGGSHAWLEVLLPPRPEDGEPAEEAELLAVAFDPTNHCMGNHNYVTIAVGLDYTDVSPTSGSFTAPYAGLLTSSKRAGLTLLQYHNSAACGDSAPDDLDEEGSAA
ncbi:MAG TPA: transglutaminase family protein [Chloroflexia bacterium]|nr:transglutaminase family protein [Chloroflexia bacterium]